LTLETFARIARFHLVTLSGGVITPAGIATALLIALGFRVIAMIAVKALRRILHARGVSAGVQFASTKISSYVIFMLGVAVAIHSIGVNLNALFAASTVILVGIGLGLQKVVENFVAGVIVLIEQPIKRGDFVRIGDTYGTVDDIGLRATRVTTRNEESIIIPNGEFVTSKVVNHSVPTLRIRLSLNVGVAYGSDVDLVKRTLLQIGQAHAEVLEAPEPEVRFEDFGESSLDFSLRFWIMDPRMDNRILSDLRFAVDAAFRLAKIEIPFPQRDVHMRASS